MYSLDRPEGDSDPVLCQLETHYWVNRYDEGATFHPLCIETQENVMHSNAWPWKQTPETFLLSDT